MTRTSIIICLLLLSMLASCGITGCSSPIIEVKSAHGFGRLEALVAGEPLSIQLETQAVAVTDGVDTLCPSYDVSLGGARVSGLAPGAPDGCSSLGVEQREATWDRLAGPVILTIFQLLAEVL